MIKDGDPLAALGEGLAEAHEVNKRGVGHRFHCPLGDWVALHLAADMVSATEPVVVALPSSRNLTLTAMSGRMRGSFSLTPMRTLTVAFSRLAVGTTAITLAGMVQSG